MVYLVMILKNIVLGIAIIILTISVAVYGIGLLYDEPEYSDFCAEFKTAEIIDTQERCEDIEGKWTETGQGVPKRVIDGAELSGFCDRDYTCRMDLEEAREKYSKNVFLIALPLGIAVLALGAFVFGLEVVGAGLMGEGIGIIFYGTWGFFWQTSDLIRFIISLIGLVLLIYLTYWFNSKDWNIWKKKGKK